MRKLMLLFALLAPGAAFAAVSDFEAGFIRGAWHAERARISMELEADGVQWKTVTAILDAPACQTPDLEAIAEGMREVFKTEKSTVIHAAIIGALARQKCLGQQE